jgi:hypothetical protein
MPLEKKLSAISKNLQIEKQQQQQAAEQEKLPPIRARIRELSDRQAALEIIKNSLDLKAEAGSGTGLGIRDYSDQAARELKVKSAQLDEAMVKHGEVLSGLGITKRDQLLGHQDFKDEEEVADYRQALEQDQDLKISDVNLRERLAALGVEVKGEFSYAAAQGAVTEKLQEVDQELLQKKLQTPEGREELQKQLAQEFERIMPWVDLNNFAKPDSFKNWRERERLLPQNCQAQAEIYGPELVRDALQQAYHSKVAEKIAVYQEKYPAEITRLAAEASQSKTAENSQDKTAAATILKQQIFARLDLGLQAEEKNWEFEQEATHHKIDGDIPSLLSLTRYAERQKLQKHEAAEALEVLAALGADLPQGEELVLEQGHIFVPSVKQAYEQLSREISIAKKGLPIFDEQIERQQQAKPKLFGKDKWQAELDKLNKDREELSQKINALKHQEGAALNQKMFYYPFPSDKFIYIDKLLKQRAARGTAAEIFTGLTAELNQLIDFTIPPTLIKLCQEYQDIEKQLN